MDVFDLRYMKRIRFTFRSVGAWPSHVFDDLPATTFSAISRYGYTTFLFTICCFTIVAEITYLYKNMGVVKFIDLGQSCLTVLMSIVYVLRTLLPIQTAYQEGIKEFSSKFHLIYYKHQTEFSAKGDCLVDAVYGLPWEYMDDSNRRTVLILLQIVQQSLGLKAGGMVPVGVQTMLAILKASFTYFLMLKTFAST